MLLLTSQWRYREKTEFIWDRVVSTMEGRHAVQSILEILEKWPEKRHGSLGTPARFNVAHARQETIT